MRRFFLHLIEEKEAAQSTVKIHLCGIKFLYETTLSHQWAVFDLVRPKRRSKLPVVLSQSQIRQILEKVKNRSARAALTTIYCCGLRLSEGTHLKVSDIDSDRMLVRVENGKGGKDRDVPLADRTLEILRRYAAEQKPKHWLFPASYVEGHIPNASLQKTFKLAQRETDVPKPTASIHTLRHSYATHLLESGVGHPKTVGPPEYFHNGTLYAYNGPQLAIVARHPQ